MSKQRIVLSIFSFFAALIMSTSAVFAAEVIPGEYLVNYKPSKAGSEFVLASLKSIGNVRLVDHNPRGRIVKVVVNNDDPRALANLMSDPNVKYLVPNIKLRKFEVSMDGEALQEQWAIKKIRAEDAWKRAGNKGSRKVTVAVIDTGVDYNHAALKPNMVPGYDFKENDADPMDKTGSANPGHGTHCAGIMGGTGLIDNGIVGSSPEMSIMPIRFLGEDGSGDLNAGIRAIDYAIEKKVDIISASWGATVQRAMAQPLVDAVKRADDAGVIFVAAAANDGRNNDATEVFPANAGFPNSITVAASGNADQKPTWSNYGKATVHIASPGEKILSTLPGGKFGELSGTSMATPLVSGIVAFLKAQDPSLTGQQMRALLQHSGVKAQIETACNCRVDMAAATDMVLDKTLFIAPAAASVAVGEKIKFEAVYGRAPFEYAVSNASAGTIAEDGTFTAAALGETTVTVKDASGKTSTTLAINVIDKTATPPGGGNCPLQNPQLCQILCQIQPTLPFCNK